MPPPSQSNAAWAEVRYLPAGTDTLRVDVWRGDGPGRRTWSLSEHTTSAWMFLVLLIEKGLRPFAPSSSSSQSHEHRPSPAGSRARVCPP